MHDRHDYKMAIQNIVRAFFKGSSSQGFHLKCSWKTKAYRIRRHTYHAKGHIQPNQIVARVLNVLVNVELFLRGI